MKSLTPEQLATQQVLLKASEMGCRLLRNNSGAMHNGERLVRFGLGEDGSVASKKMSMGDYVGITPLTITPDMVGKTIGVFTMLEIKPDGKLSATVSKATKDPNSREGKQLKAIEWVRGLGGIAWFATNQDDTEQVINLHVQAFKQ